jgi:hypothetical protein
VEVKKCPMCLETKPVVSSHLLPRAVYDYCRGPAGEPILASSKLVLASSRQIQHPLLCLDCERELNEGGEAWVVPLFAQYQGPFPFHDFFKGLVPAATLEGYESYAAVQNPDIKVEKIIHFALGVYWKAAVHSWKGGVREPSINLGPYGERIRKFLRSEAGFPERVALTIGVMRPPVKDIAFLGPYQGNARAYHNFMFYTSGIIWALLVGKAVDDEQRISCFATNPVHPVLVGDFSPDLREVFRDTLKTAKKARNVEKYLKPPKH